MIFYPHIFSINSYIMRTYRICADKNNVRIMQHLHTAFKKGHWSVEKGTIGAQKRTA